MTLDGADLSHNNWLSNPERALMSLGFAMLKASEGSTVVDGAYPKFAAIMMKYSKPWTAYGYMHPELGDPIQQAQFLWEVSHYNHAKPNSVVLDIERGIPGRPTDDFTATAVKELFRLNGGKPVGIYCARNYGVILSNSLALHGAHESVYLALATLDRSFGQVWNGHRVAINQYSWNGKLPGGSSAVDLDEYDGDRAKWDIEIAGKVSAVKDHPKVHNGKPVFVLSDFQELFIHAKVGRATGILGKAELMNRALNMVKCDAPEHSNIISKQTVAAYARWQRHLGYSGRAANGIPGERSFRELTDVTKLWEV